MPAISAIRWISNRQCASACCRTWLEERIRFIGNSSLAGPRQALLSRPARRRADEVARNVTALELTAEPRYFDEYTAALFLPHTDLTLFPSHHLSGGFTSNG